MLESTLEFFRCVRCGSKLELEVFIINKEIQEGLLECKNCKLTFPIIEKIPIMWDDFPGYLSSRKLLGGQLYRSSKDKKMKSFLKSSLSEITQSSNDSYSVEKRWSKIYQNSKSSKFYSTIKQNLDAIPKSKFVLEYGCSIGTMTSFLANSHDMVFGIDKSFSALQYAKKSIKNNLDYVLADSFSAVFGKTQFNLVLALNVLELMEPIKLIKQISKQISAGYFVISDPYDFDRGINSVQCTVTESTLRLNLENLGFKISQKTKSPMYIPWSLNLNPRATLNYEVDLIIGRK